MIIFCEDCGKKNTLMPSQLVKRQAIFTCMHCGYKNACSIDLPETDNLHEINLFLKKIIKSSPIIGAFVFHFKEKQILINHMPDTLKKTDLKILGKLLMDSYTLCLSKFTDIDELTVQISKKLLFIKMITQNHAIVIVTQNTPLPETLKRKLSNLVSPL